MRRNRMIGLAAALLFVSPALAGPPLLCFPYEIGEAKSLPWGGDRMQPSSGYDHSHLVDDTVRLLEAEPETIVRMETLRRAALYAGQSHGAAHVETMLLVRHVEQRRDRPVRRRLRRAQE